MKPLRSKREGRADRAREIQRGRRGAHRVPARTRGGGARGCRRSAACTSPGRGARDRLGRRQRPAGWGASDHSGLPTGGPAGEPIARPLCAGGPTEEWTTGRACPGVVAFGRRPLWGPGRPGIRRAPPAATVLGGGGAFVRSWNPDTILTRRPGSAGDCREPCRPVLKHGPRSLSGPQVGGPPVEAPRRNESEGRLRSGRGGIRPPGGRRTAALPRAPAAVAEEERAR